MLLIFLSVSDCVTFEKGETWWNGRVTSKEGRYICERLNVRKVRVKEEAVIRISDEENEVVVKSCTFNQISSSSGSCCFYLIAKEVFARNCCFSTLDPNYIDYWDGGSCFKIMKAINSSVENVNVFNITSSGLNIFATLGFYNTVANIKNINQTRCNCYTSVNFVCGIFLQESSSTERFIKNTELSGRIINRYVYQKANSNIEKIEFYNCSAISGIILFSPESSAAFIMKSCITKECTGTVLSYSGTVILEGWFSDKTLPPIFINTVTTEFEIPINHIDCDEISDNLVNETIALKTKISIINSISFLINNNEN